MTVMRGVLINGEGVQFFVTHDGTVHKVVLPRSILEELARTKLISADAVARSFQAHRFLIAEQTMAALNAGRRSNGSGTLVLSLPDLSHVG